MKSAHNYEIFISYRRDNGAQYARILQLMLIQRGYKVFLDYDELRDGIFSDNIKNAIISSPLFLLVLTAHSLDRCKNEEDWVRQELLLAIENNKHIIPVVPDNTFDGIPNDIPEEIMKAVSSHQYSEISFGQTLGLCIDFMIENRIAPSLGKRKVQARVDVDQEGALKHLRQNEQIQVKRKRKINGIILLALSVCLIFLASLLYIGRYEERKKMELMVDTVLDGMYLNWSQDIGLEQLQAIHEIFSNMVRVEEGTFMMGASVNKDGKYDDDVDVLFETPQIEQKVDSFWISKYEVSVAEWHRIMGSEYDESDSQKPMTNVSFDDCESFVEKLSNLTGIEFGLPTEAEWEYAARGGSRRDNTKYSGKDNADEVAWYMGNSGGHAHTRNDANGGLYCNGVNLYDMSGNVSEWCNSLFRLYKDIFLGNPNPEVLNPNAMVIRGGNYSSETCELTVTYRDSMSRDKKSETVGLRLVIK